MSNINVSVIGECIVTWKAENRKFKAAVQLSSGWLEGEGGQTRGAVAQVKAALAGMGLQAPTVVKTKEEFLGQPAVQKQGKNAAPIHARIVQSLDFGTSSRPPSQAPSQSSIPASSLVALESILGSASDSLPSQAPEKNSAPVPDATSGFDEMLSAPVAALVAAPAEKSEEKPAEKPKFQKGRKLETCYDWGAAMSDAARLHGASPEKQRIAYKFAYVVSAKCGAKGAVSAKVEKFSDAVSHLNLNISLDDIRAQLVSAGVQLRA